MLRTYKYSTERGFQFYYVLVNNYLLCSHTMEFTKTWSIESLDSFKRVSGPQNQPEPTK